MEKEQLVLPCAFDVPYTLEGPLQTRLYELFYTIPAVRMKQNKEANM